MEKIRDLKNQIEALQLRLSECQETLEAIQTGEVDALVVQGPSGDQIYTIKNAELPYRIMVETMNEGAATIATDGTIFYCNNQLASLLKVPLNKIMGRLMSNFVMPAQIPTFQSVLRGATLGTGKGEVELKSAEDATIPVLISTRLLSIEGNQMVSLIVTDLSEHKRTEQIIASEKFARTILEQAADAIVVCNNDGTVIRASERAYNLMGMALEGSHFDRVFEQFYPVLVVGNPVSRKIGRKPVRFSALYRGEIPTGSEIVFIINGQAKQRFVLNFSSLSEDGNIIGYSISLTDITKRNKAEEALAKAKNDLEIKVKKRTQELAQANEQLKEYSYRITRTQEEERKRIAYELRDELAQTLAAIKMETDLMTKKANSLLANVHSHVDSIKEMIGTSVQELRTVSDELRPSVLETLGLTDALETIIAEMNRDGQTDIVLKTNGAKRRLPDEIETALFRITQEAIRNIKEHSGATKAKVQVGFLATGIKLTIIDNGKGFDTERKPDSTLKGAYGLINMKERVHQIGGVFKIKSVLGKGTIVTITVPLQPD